MEYLVTGGRRNHRDSQEGAEIDRRMLEHTQQGRWVEVTLEHLTLGLECGRAGAFSGVTVDLAVGVVADPVDSRSWNRYHL